MKSEADLSREELTRLSKHARIQCVGTTFRGEVHLLASALKLCDPAHTAKDVEAKITALANENRRRGAGAAAGIQSARA